MKNFIFLINVFFLFTSLFSIRNFSCSNVQDKAIINITYDYKKVVKLEDKLKKDSSNILKYLPINYSTKGNIDYTDYLQKAFNKSEKVIMPNFPIAINYKGISIPSNRTIIFQQQSSLIVLPNSQSSYQALLISNSSNVKIINANLTGDRNQHIGTTGEWGMGIKIVSSNNIDIINSNIKNFWGGRDIYWKKCHWCFLF
ncbi:hypothetical protein [Chryseobacterium sp. POE27]|uniref:hypothetical protein n=1 Tax=Chryseobacterium sp. POE27 TaxID=3138177 RepID=UPI00321A9297